MAYVRGSFLTSTLNRFTPNAINGQELDWGTDVKKITCIIDKAENGFIYPGDPVQLIKTNTVSERPFVKLVTSGTKSFGVVVYDPRKTSFKAGDMITVVRNGGVVMVASTAAFSAGDILYFNTTSGCYDTTNTGVKVGMAMTEIATAATDGQLTPIEVQQQNV